MLDSRELEREVVHSTKELVKHQKFLKEDHTQLLLNDKQVIMKFAK